VHSKSSESTLNANRAYIQIDEIPGYENPSYIAPAPKQRRIATNFNETNTATGVEDVQGGNVQCTKVLINGELFILRGEKMFDATGKLVK
jgi:hypothetical protein